MHSLARLILVALFVILAGSFARAAEPPPEFTKDEARRILVAQEWQNVNVVAVVHGVSLAKVASPVLSHVLAMAYRDGRWQDLKFDVYYDRDLGWFTYESSPTIFKVWNRDGYREIKPGIGW